MLPPAQERLFMELAADHQPRSLEKLFCCVKWNDNKRVMYRRIRLLARDTENSLRIEGHRWCIINCSYGLGFMMRLRSRVSPSMLASNLRPSQKPRAKKYKRKPKPKLKARRTTWTARSPRIFLDPAKAV